MTRPPKKKGLTSAKSGAGSIYDAYDRHRYASLERKLVANPKTLFDTDDLITALVANSSEPIPASVLAAASGTYSELKNLCVWAKSNGGMGSLYRSQHELVFVFKSGRAPHINNVELGKHGRYRTNVWSYASANAFSATRNDDLTMHPTVKPVALVADAILDCSKRKGLVLDAFGGSGTTLVAVERTGRHGAAIEIDPAYCDVIVRRLAKVCGLGAVLEATGQSFDELAALRRAEAAVEEAA